MKPIWSQTLTWLAATVIALLLAIVSSDGQEIEMDAAAGAEAPR